MLSKEELDVIKERALIATAGPWEVFKDMHTKGERQIGTAWAHPQAKGPVSVVTIATSVIGREAKYFVYMQDDDANFIAHARQDVPELIAEVERLQRFEQKAIYAIEENRKLREALEFYADEDNYNIPYTRQFSDVHNEGGNIARKALGGENA